MKFRNYDLKSYNFSMLIIILILGGIGVYMMMVMPGVDAELYQDQIVGFGLGLFLAVFVSLFDYHFVSKFSIPLYMLSIGLLLVVRYTRYGIVLNNSKRWLGVKEVFSFQPSELTKIILIVFMAKFFDIMKKRINKWYTIVLALIFMGLQVFLIYKQPDLSTSVVIGVTFLALIFVAGLTYKIVIPVIVVAIPTAVAALWYLLQDYVDILEDYQKGRILALFYPEEYPDLIYQQKNAVSAISSGGLLGKLLTGDTSYRGTNYVPIHESDFIFSGIGEELGFVGTSIVIILLTILALSIIKVAQNAQDMLGKLIATGVAVSIMFQSFVNIGVVSMILPNTGLPLPFISYGLSSLCSSFIGIGLVLNIGMQKKKPKEEVYL